MLTVRTWNTLIHTFLAFKISSESSDIILLRLFFGVKFAFFRYIFRHWFFTWYFLHYRHNLWHGKVLLWCCLLRKLNVFLCLLLLFYAYKFSVLMLLNIFSTFFSFHLNYSVIYDYWYGSLHHIWYYIHDFF